jgi:serine/threonine-protein kinase
LRVLDLRTNPPKAKVLSDQVADAWALPGGEVAFVRQDGGVFAAPFDMASLTFARPPTPVMDGVRVGPTGTVDMAVSANGSAIYVPGSGRSAIAAVQPVWVTRTGAATPIDTAWTMAFDGNGGNPLAISADGRRLAVAIDRQGAGTQHDIWIKQLDQAPFTLTKLTFAGDNVGPAWTPDSRMLLFTSAGGNSPGSLRRRRADATGPVDTLLALGAQQIVEVVPTRDTTRFVLRIVAPNGSRDIVGWHRGDTTTTDLVASPTTDEANPALSPDGRWLAYASRESGRYEVYVSPFPDVTAGRWQVSQAGGVSPLWSHGGRELFYRNDANALVAATVLPGSTFTLGAQVVLFSTAGFQRFPDYIVNYAVALDDKRFVFFRPVGQAGPVGPRAPDKLVQITNWAAEVHAKLAGKAPK